MTQDARALAEAMLAHYKEQAQALGDLHLRLSQSLLMSDWDHLPVLRKAIVDAHALRGQVERCMARLLDPDKVRLDGWMAAGRDPNDWDYARIEHDIAVADLQALAADIAEVLNG